MTRVNLNTAINALISVSGSDKISAADHRDANQDILDYVDQQDATKQDSLVSGTSIKTINSTSLLGSGNIAVATLASPTFTGTPIAPTAASGTNTTQIATTAFVLANTITGSFSQAVTATTTFTVTIGVTKSGTSYKAFVTPTALLSAAVFYITNKTTTTFDVVYLAGLTGTVTFDWLVI